MGYLRGRGITVMNEITAPIKCIYCGRTDLQADEFEEVDNFEASRKVNCDDCHKWWWEIYRFSRVEYPDGSRLE